VTPALVVLALIVAGGGVIAVSAREPRFAALGMLVVLVGAAYVADPLPGTVALGARLVGAVLGGYLVWVALRGAPVPTIGSHMGWPGAAAIAIVAFLAGWLAATALGGALAAAPGEGPSAGAAAAGLAAGSPVARAATGAAFALVALAAGPVLIARDVLRLGLGALLLVAAAGLLRGALSARADNVIEVAFAVLAAAGGAAVAALVARSLRAHGDLDLRTSSSRDAPVRTRGVDDAHPLLGRRR
jgi:hypothetical protein